MAYCLINADYYTSRGIVIKKKLDFIIIENPGDVRTGKNQMLRGGVSDPRNKALMKMFNMINIGERAGSGVPNIYVVWEKEGWNLPVVEEQYNPDRTILMLSLEKKETIKSGDRKVAIKSGDKKVAIKVSVKTQEQYDKILEFMEVNKEYKASDFEDILDVKDSRLRKLLGELAEIGKIEKLGGNKDRKYKLMK